ncbi:alpha-methylacyl-CoA racemase [Capronia epimyces CBS 606.96]|uniref:Alpha-methylacyl-CoA racemase n=1 Tax=Capronia epimyces CBS 606.96 TaxID=1182542 RepID=W9XRF9_9EURO|nr:alpha-methylacyl-CoA racemase [Capronia epimyces CBS 606.96]EXJ79576.1 alpha-methylacyl-CoA racemase [Capronia epimyces CBS 606.96]
MRTTVGNVLHRANGLGLRAQKPSRPCRLRPQHGLRLPAYAKTVGFQCRRHASSSTTNLKSTQGSSPGNAAATAPSPRPLDGITVVSIEQAIAAPFCTRQLADQGARVIKIERPGVGDFARDYDTRVDGLASHFVWTNRSKESLALDLKAAKDRDILNKLLDRADVLVQNLAPGATARLGLSYDQLKDAHPSLIVCDISGYGQDGPYSQKKAYDLLVQAEAGMLSVTGTKTEPAKVGISIADIAAGMYAYSNILAALLLRQKTGRGSRLDISLLESMVEWMSFPLYYTYKGAPGPTPTGASHAAIYPYGPFDTGDGGSVMLGIQNEREWAKFCAVVLQDPGLALDPRFANNSLRVQHRDELRRLICAALAQYSVPEAVAKLDEASIANAAVNTMDGVWNHPQLRARRRWTEVETSKGFVPALLPPGFAPVDDAHPDGLRPRMDKVPDVGEHNQKILKELGIDE